MKKMKRRLLTLFLSMTLVLSIAMPAYSREDDTPEIAEGASFTEVNDVGGIDGSKFYLYVPSELYNPAPMMTPVIYVYGNQPYSNVDAAWTALTSAGLNTIAEDEHAAIIMVNPVGDTWGKEDIDVYEAIMEYINFQGGEVPLTYFNLQYAIGEGSGATFINNYLSQNAKRLAGVLTFGGEIDSPDYRYALPAYIVSGSQDAVDFYITVNDGTELIPNGGRQGEVQQLYKSYWTQEYSADKTTHIFTANPIKQVMVSKKEATSLDADLIADCWESMFRYTTRTCLTSNIWQYTVDSNLYNDDEFTLAARPNYKEAGMDVIKVDGIDNGIWSSSANNYWYEFVPEAVQKTMENSSDQKTYALMMVFHGGGDHPVYEAESVGWAQMAIDNDVILVAPNGSGVEQFMELLDYMIDKYPVDTSRIYAGGFSGGAGSTMSVTNAYPERFAAAAVMSRVSGPYYTELLGKVDDYDYDIDMPLYIVGNSMETESTNYNSEYVWNDCLQIIQEINEIPQYDGELDFVKYPFWGYPIEDEVRYSPATGFAIWSGFNYDEDGIPMLGLSHAENITHTHYPEYAAVIWDWFKDFSRDTETFEIKYKEAEQVTYTEGVSVVEDETSPTGYMAHFVYKDANASEVEVQAKFEFYKEDDYMTTYTPWEWTSDMFPVDLTGRTYYDEDGNMQKRDGYYRQAMEKIEGTDYWTTYFPIPSGAYHYTYGVDGVSITDPANLPLKNPDSIGTSSSENLSVFYGKFDESKQTVDLSAWNPAEMNGISETGTISFVKYTDYEGDQADLGIYLPYGYDANREEPYKVLYLSHGGGGIEIDWFAYGYAGNIMDNYIATGQTEEFIIVTMNNAKYNFGLNYNDDGESIGVENIIQCIIPYVEANYNVSTEASGRALSGLSMGGKFTTRVHYAYPTMFAYYAMQSVAAEDVADKLLEEIPEGFDKASLWMGAGCYDFGWNWIYDVNKDPSIGGDGGSLTYYHDTLVELGLYEDDIVLVHGAHDWFTWPTILEILASDFLWKAEEETTPIDTFLLEAAIEYAEQLKSDGALDNVFDVVKEEFEAALQNAYDVLNSTNATQDDADAAFIRLMTAISKTDWVKGDKTQLERLVTLAKATVELNGGLDKYMDTTDYEAALAAAEEVLADETAFQDEIDEKYEALWNAFKALRLKADKTALQDMITKAQTYDLALYTADSAELLNAALASAITVYEDAGLSEDNQEAVDNAVQALSDAIDNLVLLSNGESSTEDPSTGGNSSEDSSGASSTGSSTSGTSSTGGSATKNTSSTTAKNTSVAKTGDVAPYVVLVLLIAAAAFMAISLQRKSRK